MTEGQGTSARARRAAGDVCRRRVVITIIALSTAMMLVIHRGTARGEPRGGVAAEVDAGSDALTSGAGDSVPSPAPTPGKQLEPVDSQDVYALGAESPHELPDGSSDAVPRGHPGVVALFNERGLACTGALVAPRVVLTARHCLPLVEVRFGADAARSAVRRRIDATRVHPSASLDVALVRFSGAATAVPPMPVRAPKDSNEPSNVRLIGYGATDARGEQNAGRRHHSDVTARGWGCVRADAASLGCLPDYDLVLPRGSGADTCVGDSGGPVLERTGNDFRIVAVTSRAVATALLRCGDGGVYTRVDRIGEWLSRSVGALEGKK